MHHPLDDTVAVVPAFNEATTITEVIASLRSRLGEVVVVDDGSTDATRELAARAGATVLHHVVNRGQGAALQTGFDFVLRHRRSRYVVTFDADGQHRVDDAVRMVEHARVEGLDVVLASRFLGGCQDIRRSRRLLLRTAVWFSRRTTGLDLTDTHNGLRVLSRGALRCIRLRFAGMAYASELEAGIARSGLCWAEVATTVVYTDYSRAKGQSNANAVNIVFDLLLRRIGHVR